MKRTEIEATGKALAEAAFECGGRLTATGREILRDDGLYGSASYPIAKRGTSWTVDHPLLAGAGLFKTKRAAVEAWEIIIAKLVRMSGLEAQERAVRP